MRGVVSFSTVVPFNHPKVVIFPGEIKHLVILGQYPLLNLLLRLLRSTKTMSHYPTAPTIMNQASPPLIDQRVPTIGCQAAGLYAEAGSELCGSAAVAHVAGP